MPGRSSVAPEIAKSAYTCSSSTVHPCAVAYRRAVASWSSIDVSRCMSDENRAYVAARMADILRCRPPRLRGRRRLFPQEPLKQRGDDDTVDEHTKIWSHCALSKQGRRPAV